MAGLETSLNFEDVQLAAAGSWKTVVSVKAPTNQMVRVKTIAISGEGTAGDAKPVECRLVRVTADSGTGTASTPIKLNNALTATVQAAGRVNFTAEPTESGTSPYMYPFKFHPQGSFVFEKSFDTLYVKEATELAVECKIASGGTQINVSGHLVLEE